MRADVTIVDGVATADFSRELRAYGGGPLRVMLIRDQFTHTLVQFPAVREVHIAIEGQTEGVLEPWATLPQMRPSDLGSEQKAESRRQSCRGYLLLSAD